MTFLFLEELPHHHLLETFWMRDFKIFSQNERFMRFFRFWIFLMFKSFFNFTEDFFWCHFAHNLHNRLFRNCFLQKRVVVKIKIFEVDIPSHGNFPLYHQILTLPLIIQSYSLSNCSKYITNGSGQMGACTFFSMISFKLVFLHQAWLRISIIPFLLPMRFSGFLQRRSSS